MKLVHVDYMDMVPCLVVRQPRNKKEHKKILRELMSNCNKFNVLEREFTDRLFSDNIASYQELYEEFSKKWALLITSRRVCFAYTEIKPWYFYENYAPREGLNTNEV